MSRTKKLAAVAVSATVMFLVIVGGCSDSVTDENREQVAHMQVLLTDSPFPFELVDEANVTIEQIVLRGSTADSLILSDTPQPQNLLLLQNGLTAPLVDMDVPAGTYHQLRVVVSDSASVVLKSGEVYDLKIPSGSQSGIKIKLDSLEIGEGELAEITVDFSVEESFKVQGNPDTPAGIKGFIFKPVLEAKSVVVQ